MNQRELLEAIAAVLTTALDMEGEGPLPASSFYLYLGSDIHKWETVRNALVGGGFITATSETIALTPKGRELAKKCNEALAH